MSKYMANMIEVSQEWLDRMMEGIKECPWCMGSNLKEVSGNETFYKYIGCLDCDKWITHPRCK